MFVITAMLLAFVLSSALATIYRWTFQGLSYSRSFVHTMVLGSMIVSMLIMAIAFWLYAIATALARTRILIREREAQSAWIDSLEEQT